MDVAEIQTLFDYNYWANRLLLERAARLSAPELHTPIGEGQATIWSTLVHILTAEWLWRMRVHERKSPTALLTGDEFADLAALRRRWGEEEEAMRAFLAELKSERLQEVVEYRNTRGAPFQNVLWHILLHLINHGTQHRSEVALALTGRGQSPGDLDFIVYLEQADEASRNAFG
jgi:uncharacterized damage-inducible protein DinB